MPEITKAYRQRIPAIRFIGIEYGDHDRDQYGGFGKQWEDWMAGNRFAPLEDLLKGGDGDYLCKNGKKRCIFHEQCGLCAEGKAYIGLMRWKEGEPFEYRIGMFLPPDAAVPEGYASIDFPAGELGVAWVYGKMEEVFAQDEICAPALEKEGIKITGDDGAYWFFERYVHPRFTKADKQGNITLDMCYYI